MPAPVTYLFSLQTFFSVVSRRADGPFVPFEGTESQAIRAAMRQARDDGAPVDLTWPDGRDENERYIGTASPSPYHKAGARWSRSELRG